MKEIKSVKELQEIELDILKYIDVVCKENHLKYFLAYGTLIGAVRHKGFIPWDDDIDILMPRTDYKKLCHILHKEKGRYRILCCEYDKKYIYPFAKVVDSKTRLIEEDTTSEYDMGVYIDIFPYDGLRGSLEEHKVRLKMCSTLERLRVLSVLPYKATAHKVWWKNLLRIPFWLGLKLVGYRNIMKILNRLAQKDSVEHADWVGCLCAQAIYKELVPKEDVDELLDMEFEGKLFKVPKGYDRMLRTMYGDYMVLPPVEKQVSHHKFKAWWVEEK